MKAAIFCDKDNNPVRKTHGNKISTDGGGRIKKDELWGNKEHFDEKQQQQEEEEQSVDKRRLTSIRMKRRNDLSKNGSMRQPTLTDLLRLLGRGQVDRESNKRSLTTIRMRRSLPAGRHEGEEEGDNLGELYESLGKGKRTYHTSRYVYRYLLAERERQKILDKYKNGSNGVTFVPLRPYKRSWLASRFVFNRLANRSDKQQQQRGPIIRENHWENWELPEEKESVDHVPYSILERKRFMAEDPLGDETTIQDYDVRNLGGEENLSM